MVLESSSQSIGFNSKQPRCNSGACYDCRLVHTFMKYRGYTKHQWDRNKCCCYKRKIVFKGRTSCITFDSVQHFQDAYKHVARKRVHNWNVCQVKAEAYFPQPNERWLRQNPLASG